MSEAKWDHGTFSWTEVVTPDRNATKKFYTEVLGWEYEDTPMPGDTPGTYTMVRIKGQDVAGLYEITDEDSKQGMPPHFRSYIAVDSADDFVTKAKANGGTAVMEAFDIPDIGRMAMIQGPTGEMFGIWQNDSKHPGAAQLNQAHGSLAWNELATNNVDQAGKFYADTVGWEPDVADMPDGGKYTMFNVGEHPAGGMYAITEEMQGVPPHWAVYWSVNDCDKACSTAKSNGGEVLVDPTDIPGMGRFCQIRDPQGLVFGLFAPAK